MSCTIVEFGTGLVGIALDHGVDSAPPTQPDDDARMQRFLQAASAELAETPQQNTVVFRRLGQHTGLREVEFTAQPLLQLTVRP